jgi:hypothetical protein
MKTTLREDSPPENPVIKGAWQQVLTQDKRKIVRTREVWLDGREEVAARESRIDIQGTDQWVEVATLTAAYLRRLQASKVSGKPGARKPLRKAQKTAERTTQETDAS